jgi:DNA-directed RNA polymerase specialized sigma24 family protein
VLPHRNLVYKLCVRYSRAASEVEDNYSEALANFFKYIETYDPARSIQPWLHTVTKRFVGDMNRRNRALLKRSDGIDVSQMPDMSSETEAGLDMDNYSDGVLEAEHECSKRIAVANDLKALAADEKVWRVPART